MERRVIALGESVLDIIFKSGQPRAAKPGGSSFNSIISVGRTGLPAFFISDIGQDRVGDMIMDFLKENGVDSRYVLRYPESKTALSLAFLNERNDAEYEFYKDYPRQRLGDDMPEMTGNDILLFGSFYALNPVLRPGMRRFLEQAEDSLIIYDPNFRASHLDDLKMLKNYIEENLSFASVVRCSDEDLRNIYGTHSAEDSWKKISPFCKVLIYTANSHGVWLHTSGLKMYFNVKEITPVSTIGAGDSFNAGLIYGFYKNGIKKDDLAYLKESDWKQIINQAINFSSEVCGSYDNYVSRDFVESLQVRTD